MKHVIVIETVDEPEGTPIPSYLAVLLETVIDSLVTTKHGVCSIRSSFNQPSAIAAVHEMYNVPKGTIEL